MESHVDIVIPYAFAASLMILSAFAFQQDPLVPFEYINGILAASSILTGFWALVLERKPKGKVAKFLHKYAISRAFFVSLGFLIISVIMIYFNGVGMLPLKYTLLWSTCGFLWLAFFIAVYYYYEFQESQLE